MDRVAFIGFGSMGTMLIEGFIRSGRLNPKDIVLSTRTKAKLAAVKSRWHDIQTANNNVEAAAQARYIFLCVKPGDVLPVIKEIRPVIKDDSHIISIAGSVPIRIIAEMTGCAVTKVGPAITSEVCGGTSLICHNEKVSPDDAAFIEGLMRGIGGVKLISENDYDMAIELTSCMPGFISSIFQEIVRAALRQPNAISSEDTGELILNTLLGTARLIAEKGFGFDEVISRVATPGGITEEGVAILREGLPAVFDKMFERTIEKRKLLSKRFDA